MIFLLIILLCVVVEVFVEQKTKQQQGKIWKHQLTSLDMKEKYLRNAYQMPVIHVFIYPFIFEYKFSIFYLFFHKQNEISCIPVYLMNNLWA